MERELFQLVRIRARDASRAQQETPNESNDLTGFEDGRCASTFNMVEFLDELSDDARAVVQIIFNTDGPAMLATGRKRANTALMAYLQGMGWDTEKAESAFLEISSALA